MTAARTQNKPTYHHGDLRETLINAGVELVCDKGADAFTLKDASKAAGVSVAAPYRHFADKAELLFEVAEKGFIRLSELMLKNIDGMQSGEIDTIAKLGCTYVNFASAYPNLFRLMFRDHEHSPDVNLDELLNSGTSCDTKQSITDILGVHNPDINGNMLMQNAPNEGIGCYSLLLKNVAIFLVKNGKNASETLGIATQMWATVHGMACLLIDRNFQNMMPNKSTDEMITQSTTYYLAGLLSTETS